MILLVLVEMVIRGPGLTLVLFGLKHQKDCSVTAKGAVGSTVTIFGAKLKVEADGYATLSVSNASTSCKTGGYEQCSSLSCGNFWIQYAQANGTAAN